MNIDATVKHLIRKKSKTGTPYYEFCVFNFIKEVFLIRNNTKVPQ